MSRRDRSGTSVNQTGNPGLLGGLMRNPKFVFVLICFIIMIYSSVALTDTGTKVSIMLGIPIIILLTIMGAEHYVLNWVRRASLPRTLISGFSFIIVGASMAVISAGGLILGFLLILAAVLLLGYDLWRFIVTKDLRSKGQDKIVTLALVPFMASILLLVLGAGSIALLLFMASIVVFLYKSSIFDVIIIVVSAALLFTTLTEVIFGVTLVALGVVAEIGGILVKRKEAMERKFATVTQAT